METFRDTIEKIKKKYNLKHLEMTKIDFHTALKRYKNKKNISKEN